MTHEFFGEARAPNARRTRAERAPNARRTRAERAPPAPQTPSRRANRTRRADRPTPVDTARPIGHHADERLPPCRPCSYPRRKDP